MFGGGGVQADAKGKPVEVDSPDFRNLTQMVRLGISKL